jgi:hypothetical protein
MHKESQPPDEERSRFGIALVAADALVLFVVVFFYLFSSGPRSGPLREAQLPFGSAEQAYAPRIELRHFSMSRAENFVHQEVTMLSGEVANAGEQALAEVEVTVEFRDSLNQVVLRETRRLFGAAGPPLAPNQPRSFRLSFEHIPNDWNRQIPSVRITGLKFA